MKIRFSPLLATGVRTMVPTLLIFSVWLLVVGHDLPGGGFAGGLVAGAALLLLFLAFGSRGVRRLLPFDPESIAGAGLALALLSGMIGLLVGGAFLGYEYVSRDLPYVGEVKVSTLLLFDVGVYVLVVGLIATALERLGSDRS
jgi:multisubunit Na+/H+ antiporter MnhB subunit